MSKRLDRRLEHLPVEAYHLLRRLDQAAIASETLFGVEDEYTVQLLVSRGLARLTDSCLTITPSGRTIGEIRDERDPVGFVNQPHLELPRRKNLRASGSSGLFSETLIDAAQNIDQLSRAHVLILIREAIKVVQLSESEAHETARAANGNSLRPHVPH